MLLSKVTYSALYMVIHFFLSVCKKIANRYLLRIVFIFHCHYSHAPMMDSERAGVLLAAVLIDLHPVFPTHRLYLGGQQQYPPPAAISSCISHTSATLAQYLATFRPFWRLFFHNRYILTNLATFLKKP